MLKNKAKKSAKNGKPQNYLHPELQNLVPEIEEEKLKAIAARTIEAYRSDEDSRTEWMENHAQWVRLYFQADKPMNPPWEGASEESIPMLTEACTQFSARAFKAMFPNRHFIRAIPDGKSDGAARERAERVGTHMSWQCLTKDKTYKRNKDRMLTALPLHGSVFTKAYYCPVRKRNVVDNVRAVDLVVPYGTGPREIEDIDRITHIIYMTVERTQILASEGFLSEPAVECSMIEKTAVDREAEDVEGIEEPLEGETAMLIEQHRYIDLDGDGIPEPYIVTVDLEAEKVLRLSIGYETDEAGNPKDGMKRRVEYFTHYVFMENPDGFYGLGHGHLLGPLNTAANKLLRQSVDASTLANVGNHSGFISTTLATRKGELKMKLGKLVPISQSAEDIAKGIYTFNFPGPQAATLQIMEALMARGDRLGTVTEAVTGQTEKVMQPTTILALIEQAMETFSAVYERVLDSWERELAMLYRLNRKHMDPAEYFTVLDVSGELQEASAGRADYDEDMQIKPVADPKMTTERQKMARAEAEYQFAMSNPLIANSPQHIYNASKRFLIAIGSEDIGELLPDVMNAQMQRVDDPAMENSMVLQSSPSIPPAFPDQDHIEHIKQHQSLLDDEEYGMLLTDVGHQLVHEHIKNHIALMYGAVETSHGGQSGLGGVEASAGNGGTDALSGDGVPPELAQLLGGSGPGEDAGSS